MYYGIDPSNGKTLWHVTMATQQDVDDAVVAANAAFKSWSKLQHGERHKLLNAFADDLERHKLELTQLLSKETGKTVRIPN